MRCCRGGRGRGAVLGIISTRPFSVSPSMSVSRRTFVSTLGAGATGILAAPLINWRGHEELLAQAAASAEARSERLLAAQPGMIRLDSNENPNGPGRRALDAIGHRFGL